MWTLVEAKKQHEHDKIRLWTVHCHLCPQMPPRLVKLSRVALTSRNSLAQWPRARRPAIAIRKHVILDQGGREALTSRNNLAQRPRARRPTIAIQEHPISDIRVLRHRAYFLETQRLEYIRTHLSRHVHSVFGRPVPLQPQCCLSAHILPQPIVTILRRPGSRTDVSS